MEKAAIYARYSTDRQNESSIEDQVRVCTEYARAHGFRVAHQFEDKGISGAALGNRPGVIHMQEASLARAFDVLLIADLSRLSRSQADLPKLIDRLVAKGIHVVGVQDGYDSARKGHKVQAGFSGVMGEWFRDMVKEKTHAALETRAKAQRPVGGKTYGYATGVRAVVPEEAAIVREIFRRYVDGDGCRAIAARLNKRGVPSPGSRWAGRTERRCNGWMGSAVRIILRNPTYVGSVIWNRSEWVKDPDTGKRHRRDRPATEWHEYQDDALRIIDDLTWAAARSRIQESAGAFGDHSKRAGGRPRYLLSGLLVCADCGANFILSDARCYSCGSHIGGKDCANTVRLPRAVAEQKIVVPIKAQLDDPDFVAVMEQEMQRYYTHRLRQRGTPKEVQDLDARIARLRARLKTGDPDMPADEIQAAIDRAIGKRAELAGSAKGTGARVVRLLPAVADAYRRQLQRGLDGHPAHMADARTALRSLVGGRITLQRGKAAGSLFAAYNLHRTALLEGLQVRSGSGGTIR
jgi:DNA invertase Pin-like site-specific DNA recombinase